MNIVRFLKDQHDEVNDLLDKIVLNAGSESRSLLETISKALRLHMRIEETIVYPAASRCFEGNRKRSVLESYEEHEFVKQCLSALESTPATDKRFVARAKVLKAILRAHVLEEESELFPLLAAKLGQSGIEMLGNEVERQVSRLEAQSAPRRAKRATTKPRRAKSRAAKVAQTRRRRTAVRGGKATASRRNASASRSAKRHRG
jgi:hemerythrin-like domain-containing protein